MQHKIKTLKKKALLTALQVEILENLNQNDTIQWFSVEIYGQEIESEGYYLEVEFKIYNDFCDNLEITTNTVLKSYEVSRAIDEILRQINK